MMGPLSELRGLCHESRHRDEELRRGFVELKQRLVDATEGVDAYGSSDICTLETYGDDEAIYGYLFFRGSALEVAYRSTEEDLTDSLNDNRGDPTYSVSKPLKCSALWLRVLAAPPIIESLVASLHETMRTSISATADGIQALAATANLSVRDLESSFVAVAKSLTYEAVLEDWRHAQAALGVDPSDAATRACRLLESLCKHILETRGREIPATQTIQKLFKSAAQSLDLSPDPQTSRDLQTIASGISSIVQGIGSLRTHSGTAHGRSAGHHKVTFSEARLAVNSAGAVATFLMEALLSLSGDSA